MPIKLTAASRRRPGLTRADYFRYIEHFHGTIARQERFKIASYIQNHVIDGGFGVLSDKAHQLIADPEGVVYINFDCFPDLMSILEPVIPEGQISAAAQDGKFFADESTNIIVMAEEEEIPVPNPQPCGIGHLSALTHCLFWLRPACSSSAVVADFSDPLYISPNSSFSIT